MWRNASSISCDVKALFPSVPWVKTHENPVAWTKKSKGCRNMSHVWIRPTLHSELHFTKQLPGQQWATSSSSHFANELAKALLVDLVLNHPAMKGLECGWHFSGNFTAYLASLMRGVWFILNLLCICTSTVIPFLQEKSCRGRISVQEPLVKGGYAKLLFLITDHVEN